MLAFQYDMFSLKVLIIFHLWNLYQIIPVIICLYYGSKTVSNCNELMISVGRIVNEWDDEEVLNRVCLNMSIIMIIKYDLNPISVQIPGNTVY